MPLTISTTLYKNHPIYNIKLLVKIKTTYQHKSDLLYRNKIPSSNLLV